jgi:hypothetical protein
MEITPAFNDAAQGGGGLSQLAHGPDGHSPGGDGTAAETPETKTGTEVASASARLANEFNSVTAEPEAPGREREESADDGRPSIADAKAELETLEAGRPAPGPRAELKPPPHLVRIVNSGSERRREARISALKAYLEFQGSGPEHALQQEHGNCPEPAL